MLDIFGVALAVRIERPHARRRRRLLVVAGGKRRAGTGEDDGAHVAVGIGLVERAVDFRLEIARQRVHAVGPVQRDGRDLAVDAVKQILVAHSPSRVSWPQSYTAARADGRARPNVSAWLIRATGGSWGQIAMSIAGECC